MKITVKDNKDKEYKIHIESKNSKLGNIANFSVKKGMGAYCKKNCNKCYSGHMQMYSSHVKHVESNFTAVNSSKTDKILRNNIINAINNYIKLHGCNIFRFNVEGDIDDNYLKMILEIAINTSDCKIYLYTKNHEIVKKNINDIINIKNLTILLSIMNYNNSYIISDFRNYDNIKFFITTRNEKERLIYYKTYRFDYFKCCKNDTNKDMKCSGCKLCFDNKESKFIFNEYRGLKKVRKDTIPYINVFSKTLNRFKKNDFLNTALKEALTAIFCHTTATKKELSNLNKLVDVKIRSYSKNSEKEYGNCKKINGYFKITLNNLDYFKTVCTLMHELLHVLVFEHKHSGKFQKYSKEIEENTIYSINGNLNNINYNGCLDLENKVKDLTREYCITHIINSSHTYFNSHSKNCLLMKYSNVICNDLSKFKNYANLRSIITRTVKNTLKKEYANILDNIND